MQQLFLYFPATNKYLILVNGVISLVLYFYKKEKPDKAMKDMFNVSYVCICI